ncbi:MAG: hypothetical protein LBI02_11665 [Opitutaceae bacterium]|jgi:hypothetical protein|nr:hypothetical protein [Opitutaceae bacterium]
MNARRPTRPAAPLALALLALAPAALFAQPAANPPAARKIYADYHNTRLTRAHDGATGHWSYSATAAKSAQPHPSVNFNADLVGPDGRHQLATVLYPLVGMQSELDPVYLEYQILSAKTAHIDGFLVEWGFATHRSELVRRALAGLAGRYDFEIGLNLCDRWLFQQLPWQRPELTDRKALFAEFFRNYHYLLTEVFPHPAAVRFRHRPVMFLFGNGLTPAEFEQLRTSKTTRSIPGAHPVVLLNSMKGAPWFDSRRGLLPGAQGVFPWVPPRERRAGDPAMLAHWDRYGTQADAVAYQKNIADFIKKARGLTADGDQAPRVGVATPGFDNRACAGWGFDFSHLPRGNGELYRAMWDHNLKNVRQLDWVFLPTWNDWTENSQLEPSVEDQGEFLRITETCAAQFKGIPSDPTLTALPLRLFQLRRRAQTIRHPDTLRRGHALLDQAALALSRLDAPNARALLADAETLVSTAAPKLAPAKTIRLEARDGKLLPAAPTPAPPTAKAARADAAPLRFRMDDDTAAALREYAYEAFLDFEYKPLAKGRLIIRTPAQRAKTDLGDFGIVADLNFLDAGDWQAGRVRLFAENAAWNHTLEEGADLEFSGPAEIRNATLAITLLEDTAINHGVASGIVASSE